MPKSEIFSYEERKFRRDALLLRVLHEFAADSNLYDQDPSVIDDIEDAFSETVEMLIDLNAHLSDEEILRYLASILFFVPRSNAEFTDESQNQTLN